jgi:tetratricopeptide (TPR) repeat protein
MPDLITDFLERLAKAKGDPHTQSALAAEFALAARPEVERESLRAALDAAAVLRWFDPGLLAKMLNTRHDDAQQLFEALKALPFVELYGRGGGSFRNVHESTRLGWRKQIAHNRPERFRDLSSRAAACFADDLTSSGRIEWIYHLLCHDPDRGATELEKLDREWSSTHVEDRYALAAALRELEDTQLVQGRARVWVLLNIAWTRASRGETAQMSDAARRALHLARSVADPRAEADAQCLSGDVLVEQGKLAEAQAAFGEYLAISRRLAEQDRGNAGWQRELAVAHSRIGDVLRAQGKLAEAQTAFGEDLAISRRLAEQDPINVGWQHDLAVTHSKIGDVLRAQGKLAEAQAAFGEYLAISRRLTEQDSSNAGMQRDLAVAHSKIGDVLRAQGKLAEAQVAFGEHLTISRRLAVQDPSNASWQRELAVAHSKIGDVLQAQGKLAEAQGMFGEYLAISRRLAVQDPSNASWQCGLAVAHSKIGDVLQEQGKLAEAQAAFVEDLAISRRLAAQDPINADWQHDLAVTQSRMGDVLHAQGKLAEAQAVFGEYLATSRRLAAQDPINADWQHGLAVACVRFARLESNVGNHNAALLLYEEATRILSDLVKAPGFAQWAEERDAVESELALCRAEVQADKA